MLITGTDFVDGFVDYTGCHYVDKCRYDQDKNIQIHNGCILITKDGTLGKVAYVQDLLMPATLNAGVFNVTIKEKELVDGKYLFQYLKAPFLMNYVNMRATGGTIKHLNQNILIDFPILLPEKDEQQKIGCLFYQLDSLITLHQRKQIIINSHRYKKSVLFCYSWEQRKLSDVATYRNGKAHEDSINVDGKFIVVNSKFVSTNGDVIKKSDYQNEPLYKNEIAFVLSDVPNGRALARTFLVKKSDKYTLNQRIAGITPNIYTYPYFLYILMNRHKYFLSFDDGAKQTNLSVNDVIKFETKYPSYIEQKKIGDLFDQLDSLITLHQRKQFRLEGKKYDKKTTKRIIL